MGGADGSLLGHARVPGGHELHKRPEFMSAFECEVEHVRMYACMNAQSFTHAHPCALMLIPMYEWEGEGQVQPHFVVAGSAGQGAVFPETPVPPPRGLDAGGCDGDMESVVVASPINRDVVRGDARYCAAPARQPNLLAGGGHLRRVGAAAADVADCRRGSPLGRHSWPRRSSGLPLNARPPLPSIHPFGRQMTGEASQSGGW